jgi:hypothetical protein
VWQLRQPPGGVLGGVVEDAVINALKHHVVRALDLTIAAWVCHRVVDVDEVVLAEVLEVRPCEGRS